MSASKSKNIKFKVSTVHANDEDIYVKRATHKNTLYIYVYQRGIIKDHLLVALKVVVNT